MKTLLTVFLLFCSLCAMSFEKIPYERALQLAESDNGAGCLSLAVYYAEGVKVARSSEKAYEYLLKAKEQNDKDALLLYALVTEGYSTKRGIGMFNSDVRSRIERIFGVQAGGFLSASIQSFTFEDSQIEEVKKCYQLAMDGGSLQARGEFDRFEKRVKAYNDTKAKRLTQEEKKALSMALCQKGC